MFENETYTVTSLEEIVEAHDNLKKANKDYKNKLKDYLLTCLCDAGIAKVKVRAKKENVVGYVEVIENSYSLLYPYKLAFFPIKKNGEKSLKHKYVTGLVCLLSEHENLTEKLISLFEVVGDNNAS